MLFSIAGERISRIKHDASLPHNAIWICLEFAKVSPDEPDFTCQGWPALGKCLLRTRSALLADSVQLLTSTW